MVNYIKKITGFTLIELIIVIGIIALLSTIGLITYNSVQGDARNAKRKSDLRELQTALEQYKLRNNSRYPNTLVGGARKWFGTCNNPSWSGGFVADLSGATGYIPNLAPEYIPVLPTDPRDQKVNTSASYPSCRTNTNWNCYLYSSDGINYKLIAHCTPEGTMTTDDPFFDQARYNAANSYFWAWQVHSSNASVAW